MTIETPTKRRRGKALHQPLSLHRAAEGQRAREAARLNHTPLNVLITAVPRLARQGFIPPGHGKMIGAFRTALTKLITHHLGKLGLPVLWVASIENAKGRGDHVHIAVHVSPDRQAEILPPLEAAIRRRFDWDMEAIEKENRQRLQRGCDLLVFNPVKIDPAIYQFPEGEGFIDYITKGAFEPQGKFASTLTISHELQELKRQKSAETAHIIPDTLHRSYALEAYKARNKAGQEALVVKLKVAWEKLSTRVDGSSSSLSNPLPSGQPTIIESAQR